MERASDVTSKEENQHQRWQVGAGRARTVQPAADRPASGSIVSFYIFVFSHLIVPVCWLAGLNHGCHQSGDSTGNRTSNETRFGAMHLQYRRFVPLLYEHVRSVGLDLQTALLTGTSWRGGASNQGKSGRRLDGDRGRLHMQ